MKVSPCLKRLGFLTREGWKSKFCKDGPHLNDHNFPSAATATNFHRVERGTPLSFPFINFPTIPGMGLKFQPLPSMVPHASGEDTSVIFSSTKNLLTLLLLGDVLRFPKNLRWSQAGRIPNRYVRGSKMTGGVTVSSCDFLISLN